MKVTPKKLKVLQHRPTRFIYDQVCAERDQLKRELAAVVAERDELSAALGEITNSPQGAFIKQRDEALAENNRLKLELERVENITRIQQKQIERLLDARDDALAKLATAQAACAEMRQIISNPPACPNFGVQKKWGNPFSNPHREMGGVEGPREYPVEITTTVPLSEILKQDMPRPCGFCSVCEFVKHSQHALSSDCGKGWRSTAEWETLEKKCAEKDAMLGGLSRSVTTLALAIDPTSTHGPEAEKIAGYLNQQMTEKDAKIAALWVTIEQCGCRCYIVGTDGTDGGSPKTVKCPRCTALENLDDLGKDFSSRTDAEAQPLVEALTRILNYWDGSPQGAEDAAMTNRAVARKALAAHARAKGLLKE